MVKTFRFQELDHYPSIFATFLHLLSNCTTTALYSKDGAIMLFEKEQKMVKRSI